MALPQQDDYIEQIHRLEGLMAYNEEGSANDWGRPNDPDLPEGEEMPWLHSDIKNMAYYYVYPAFTNIVEKGALK